MPVRHGPTRKADPTHCLRCGQAFGAPRPDLFVQWSFRRRRPSPLMKWRPTFLFHSSCGGLGPPQESLETDHRRRGTGQTPLAGTARSASDASPTPRPADRWDGFLTRRAMRGRSPSMPAATESHPMTLAARRDADLRHAPHVGL